MRAGEWWGDKLVPIFAVFYATALTLDVPVASLWRAALTILLALVPGAAYVSVLNDFTDRADDLRAGKPNRLTNTRWPLVALLLAVTAGAGVVFSFLWRHDLPLLLPYLAAWIAFSLYSLPPFRLKTRGVFGVLADASGAHLFPTVVAVVLTFREAGHRVLVPWLATVAVWAFAQGLRGILWHQLSDLENDRVADVHTFAVRHPVAAARLGKWIAFPIELAALTAMLWQIGSVAAVVALIPYAWFVKRRIDWWRMNLVIVEPRERFVIVMNEYYAAFLAPAILIESAMRHPVDAIVLIMHFVVFSGPPRDAARTMLRLWRHRSR